MLVSDQGKLHFGEITNVLILVLVDVGLGLSSVKRCVKRYVVLILVLVDVGLGRVPSTESR